MKKSLRIGMTALLALAGLSSCTISDMGGSSSQSSEPSARYFTCTFNNWDGAKLYSADFKEGTAAVYEGPAPSKPDTTAEGHTAHWTFSGWDKPLDGVTSATTFRATYTSETYPGHIVTFCDADGTRLRSEAVEDGGSAFYSGSVDDLVDEHFSYTESDVTMFAGWDGTLDGITSDKEVRAITAKIDRKQNGEWAARPAWNLYELFEDVVKDNREQETFFDYLGKKYYWGRYTWYNFKPIKWRYMRSVSSGVAEFISSDLLVTRHCWNASSDDYADGTHANNYAKSDIRSWLNGEFLAKAFPSEPSLLQEASVSNGPSTTSSPDNPYACEDTLDKVYLPSYQDVTNEAYGFASDNDRIAYDEDGIASSWWTRTPSASDPAGVHFVYNGIADNVATLGWGTRYDRPCVQLKIA